jgi:hypothetical protein
MLHTKKKDTSRETIHQAQIFSTRKKKDQNCFALIKVIRKVTLSFTPYPLFQWYPQSKEIFIKSHYEMLKLSS